jgi:NAD(P)-dependent dehydrogenase (short-subunit alcohol dehydrogenase family)
VADQITKAGGTAIADSGDVSTVEGGKQAVDAAVSEWGRVDIVVNNAGNVIYGALPEVDVSVFDAVLAVHVRGTFNVTRAAWPHMLAQNYGRVVLTGSTGMFGMPDNLSYATAKSAMIGMAQAMTVNAGEADIKVNVIAPNAWTRMAGSTWPAAGGSPGCSSPPPTATCSQTTSHRRSRTSPPTGRRSTTRPATTCQPAR